MTRILCLPFFLMLLSAPRTWANEPLPPEYPDHSSLLVYRSADGTEHPVRDKEDWGIRRAHILAGMQQVMGPLPERTNLPPLDARILDRAKIDDVVRLTMTLETEPGDRLWAYLFLPEEKMPEPRRPGILALHPTARELGKKIVAGQGPRPNRAYALELARRGYVVIAPDYLNSGDYQVDFRVAGYLSATMKGIFNHMRCIDLLQSRDDVDPERLGAIGHSLGGHNAMFVGVFDPRIKAIVSSCGWTPFHDYYGGNLAGWSHDGYMPLLKTKYALDPDRVPFDFYEVVAALAPRAFFSNSPLGDDNFDHRGVRKAIAQAKTVYALFDAAEELQVRYPDAGHDFPPKVRREAYQFLDRVLKHTPRDCVLEGEERRMTKP